MNKHIHNPARKRGFTLIELLVVVIIIGILAAIAVPIFLNQRKAAWKASAVSDASNASLAIGTARTQTGTLDGVSIADGKNGSPMTITLNGETTKATVSPGNTETAWISKTPSGEPCYAVMTTNANLGSWAAVRTSEGSMTTGTPPANGSADCPAPASTPIETEVRLYVSTPNQTGLAVVSLDAKGSRGVGPSAFAVTSRYMDGSTAALAPGDSWFLSDMQSFSKVGDGAWTYPAIVSINGKPQSAFSKESAASNPAWGGTLRIVLDNGGVFTVDTSAADPSGWTGTFTPASA